MVDDYQPGCGPLSVQVVVYDRFERVILVHKDQRQPLAFQSARVQLTGRVLPVKISVAKKLA